MSRKRLVMKLLDWFRQNARDLPWRRTVDPYAIWVSEIMLQQTQVKTVIPYWERWVKLFPNVRSLAEAPEEKVLKAWEGLGYYSRARNLRKGAAQVITEFRGKFPNHFENVLKLPGIGRYTAGAICSIAFNQPTAILDGNVARVLSRIYLIDGDIKVNSVRDRLWAIAHKLVHEAASLPGRSCSDLNQSLMELGALICTPNNPSCRNCPVRRFCEAYKQNAVDQYPQSSPRKKPKQKLHFAFVLEKNGSGLIRRRPSGQVNAGFWEFPNFEAAKRKSAAEQIAAFLQRDSGRLALWHTLKHSITTNRITLKTYRLQVNGEARQLKDALGCDWHPISKLENLPFTGAHSKLRSLLTAI